MERMNRRAFIRASVGAGMGGGLGLVGGRVLGAGGKKTKRPNILWIMMDDGRADALGCYGRPWARTPHMDAIAAKGVRFASAIVQNPVCVPSRKSMKSGLYPHTFGVTAMGRPPEAAPAYMKRARTDVPNLLNRWKEAGVNPVNVGKTHAYQEDWVRKGDVPPAFNVVGRTNRKDLRERLDKAGRKYPEVVTKTHGWAIGGRLPMVPEEMSTWKLGDLAIETLKKLTAKGEPFFLRVSFHAPHVACRVPDSYYIDPSTIALPLPTEEELASKPRFERENLQTYSGCPDLTKEQIGVARGTYYGMVWLVDTQVGRLVECLRQAGALDDTIIAINSDQGFQLGEHGLWKKRVFYEQNVCVPLILSCPGLLPAARVIEEPVEMVDFVPTLMEISGFERPEAIRGKSLCPLMRGEVKKWREACFSEIDHSGSMYEELRNDSGRRVMVRTKEWKLIYFMDERVADKDGALYDLINDPGEKENLYGRAEHADFARRLEFLAERWDRTA